MLFSRLKQYLGRVKRTLIMFFLITVASLRLSAQVSQSQPAKGDPYDPNYLFTVKQLQFDLAVVKYAFVKAHPGLYWYQNPDEFEAEYSRLKNALIKPMTEMEFFSFISPFISSIRCGHTEIDFSDNFNRKVLEKIKILPLGTKNIDNRIFIYQNYTNDTSIAIGSEVLTIKGIRADSVLSFMKPFEWMGMDGDKRNYWRVDELMLSVYGLFRNAENYELETITPNGQHKRLSLAGLELGIINQIYDTRYDASKGKDYSSFQFKMIDSLSTGVIRIDEFRGKHFNRQLARTFKSLRKNNTKHLIIDLRGNTGGMCDYARSLYANIALHDFKFYEKNDIVLNNLHDSVFKYGKLDNHFWRLKNFIRFGWYRETAPGRYDLKNITDRGLRQSHQPRRNNFRGDVFILIDEQSFSATTEFCAVAKFNKRVKFVGRETGGGYCGNTGGEDMELILPNTKIEVDIPLIRYVMAVEGECGRGIIPDYVRKQNIMDIVNNYDADLMFTLNLIGELQSQK